MKVSGRRRRDVRARVRLSGNGATATIRWAGEGLYSDPLRLTLADLPAHPYDRHAALLAAVAAHSPPESPAAWCVATRWADAAERAIDAALLG